MAEARYPRDLHGYGRNPPDPKWPGGARVAVQFVVNFEEGGENNVLHGDRASEAFLSDVLGAQPCRMLFSPPSSKFTTNCTATRALPGQRGSGGLRP